MDDPHRKLMQASSHLEGPENSEKSVNTLHASRQKDDPDSPGTGGNGARGTTAGMVGCTRSSSLSSISDDTRAESLASPRGIKSPKSAEGCVDGDNRAISHLTGVSDSGSVSLAIEEPQSLSSPNQTFSDQISPRESSAEQAEGIRKQAGDGVDFLQPMGSYRSSQPSNPTDRVPANVDEDAEKRSPAVQTAAEAFPSTSTQGSVAQSMAGPATSPTQSPIATVPADHQGGLESLGPEPMASLEVNLSTASGHDQTQTQPYSAASSTAVSSAAFSTASSVTSSATSLTAFLMGYSVSSSTASSAVSGAAFGQQEQVQTVIDIESGTMPEPNGQYSSTVVDLRSGQEDRMDQPDLPVIDEQLPLDRGGKLIQRSYSLSLSRSLSLCLPVCLSVCLSLSPLSLIHISEPTRHQNISLILY